MKHWIVKSMLFVMCLFPCWFSFTRFQSDSSCSGIGISVSAILIGIFFPKKAWRKAFLLTVLVPILFFLLSNLIPTTDGAILESEAVLFSLLPITFPFIFLTIAIYTFPGVYLGVWLNFLLLQPVYKLFFHKELNI